MEVRAFTAVIPTHKSLAVSIGKDPSLDLVIGHDLKIAASPAPGLAAIAATTPPFVPASQGQALSLARSKVVGQRIAFANAGFTMLDKGLPLAGVTIPSSADTVLEIVGVAISGAETIHAFTREDASPWNQALAVANTVSSVTELISPLLPALKPYEPALKGISLILKVVKSGNEMMKSETEYRVLQVEVGK